MTGENDNLAGEFYQNLKDIHSVTNASVTGALAASVESIDTADELLEFRGFMGQLGDSIAVSSIGYELVAGDSDAAAQQAAELFALKMIEAGYKDVLERIVDTDLPGGSGLPSRGAALQGALRDQIAGHLADVTVDGAKQILSDNYSDGTSSTDPRLQVIRTQAYEVLTAAREGNLDEHGHFQDVNNIMSRNPDNLPPKPYRDYVTVPNQSNFDDRLMEAVDAHADGISANLRPTLFGVEVPFTEDPGSMSDLVRVNQSSGSASLDFTLDAAEIYGDDLRGDIRSHTFSYLADAQTNDDRDIDTNYVAGLTDEATRDAEYLSVDLGAQSNPDFYGGRIDASQNDGGTVIVGRDGGNFIGSEFDDVILDGSDVSGRAGDDVIIMDREWRGDAFGGRDNDYIVGGQSQEPSRGDDLHGGVGEDVINGDKGDDTLHGTGRDNDHDRRDLSDIPDDGVRDVLIGGEGRDIYYAGDNDEIQATVGHDTQDVINFNGITLEGIDEDRSTGESLIGKNGEVYEVSEDGRTVNVTHQGETLTITNYTDGDFGLYGVNAPIIVNGERPVQDDASNNAMPSRPGVTPTQFAGAAGAPMALEDAVGFMSGNADAIRADIAAREAAGTATPEEQALGQVLQTPESATVFGDLDAAGVTELDVDLPAEATPTQTGVAIYDAVGTAVDANNIAVSTPDAAAAPENSIPENTTPTQVAEATAENEYGTFI